MKNTDTHAKIYKQTPKYMDTRKTRTHALKYMNKRPNIWTHDEKYGHSKIYERLNIWTHDEKHGHTLKYMNIRLNIRTQ
jgi:phosphoribosyl-AMP cyclohydrolase